MPSTIELDVKHWVKVSPVEEAQMVVTARGFASYYANTPAPPETISGATELAVASALTIENQSGRWFKAKEPASTEVPVQPAQLEVKAPEDVGEVFVKTANIASEAVTAAKIASEAVTAAKIKPAAVPAVAAAKTVKVGTSGGDRIVLANLKGDGGTTLKYKIKHGLKTEAFAISYQKDNTEKPGEPILSPVEKVAPISEEEVELTFAAGKPANNEIIWVRIEA